VLGVESPRFKCRDRFDPVEFPRHGYGIRPHQGEIKTVSITREAAKWFVMLYCDLGEVAVASAGLPEVAHCLTILVTESDPLPQDDVTHHRRHTMHTKVSTQTKRELLQALRGRYESVVRGFTQGYAHAQKRATSVTRFFRRNLPSPEAEGGCGEKSCSVHAGVAHAKSQKWPHLKTLLTVQDHRRA